MTKSYAVIPLRHSYRNDSVSFMNLISRIPVQRRQGVNVFELLEIKEQDGRAVAIISMVRLDKFEYLPERKNGV